ncbi:hypothetical protein IJO12_01655 [bacterium]|nr:hypothetical protein [bacterium]
MLNTSLCNMYSCNTYNSAPNFKAKSGEIKSAQESVQIDALQKDEYVSNNDNKKKMKRGTKRALTIGSTVVGISLAVSVLNPKISSKLIKNLKNASLNMNNKMKKNKDKILASKFYKKMAGFYDWSSRAVTSINNVNSVKDTYFMKLCCEEKSFLNVRDKGKRNFLQKIDNVFRKIFKKPHELITKWSDDLAKATVKSGYRKTLRQADALENLIKQYKDKLSVEDKILLDNMLSKIKQNKNFMSESKIIERFKEQEDLMTCLNADIRNYFQRFQHGFRNHHVKNSSHINNNLSFWAEDMLRVDKNRILANGNDFVDTLLGKKSGEKGGYKEVLEFLSSKLDKNDISQLNKSYKKLEKQLLKANKNECFEYFDKKRDLVLGSAPTDIVSATLLMGLSGIRVAAADDKDEKISRVITGVIPTAAGAVVSIAMTSLLYSGIQGILIGGLSGVVLSKIATIIDNARLKAKGKTDEEIERMEELC